MTSLNITRIYAQISIDNLLWNLSLMKKRLPKYTLIYAVLKADAYGNGAIYIAKELEKVSYVFGYCIATSDEAIELRKAGIKKPMLVLGYTFPDMIESSVKNDISMTVYNFDIAKSISEIAKKLNKIAKIHIAIDTGMNRIGYNVNEKSVLEIKKISKLSNIEIEGVFTHFSKADEKDKAYTKKQQDLFNKMKEMLKNENVKYSYAHSANSAAILDFPEAYTHLVRLGITMYGMWPSSDTRKDDVPLRPVLSLYSSVINIHKIEKGSLVGYGGVFESTGPVTVATISAGYADGVPRSISNKGYVLIHGKKAKILGRICMDQMMVDITDISDVKLNDKVTLIGTDHDLTITMEDLSDISGRLNYEISCNLSSRRVAHIYIKNNEVIFKRFCL